ncbi:MAG TPA: potassium-transporting ATPase subunit KdpA [Thermoplasmata archaeon]|nr:potassium-transporting ATPase subunit KdpA [Thermoplasmata archaeon]
MLASSSLADVLFTLALGLVLARWLGIYMAKIYQGRPTVLDPIFNPLDRGIYRVLGIDPRRSMGWKEYAACLLVTNALALVFVFTLLLYQGALPYNAWHVPGMTWDLAFHTSSAFTTNTDFQHYAPEQQTSLVASLFGLQTLMFLSAASGIVVLVAFVRGFVRKDGTVGNFWSDIVRTFTRLLVPLTALGALLLILAGVPETLAQSTHSALFAGGFQIVPTGPVASWDSIELIGTNGGGYFAANAAHPLQNPTALTNMIEIVMMMLLTFAPPFMFGRMVKRPNEAWPHIGAIVIIFVAALLLLFYFEAGNPFLSGLNVSQSSGYYVGAESRFSIAESVLFQGISVYGNVGATSLSLGSLTPGAQSVLLWGMFLQCAPGGEGTGFGMLLINALLAIFVGGLMVGRTPEYLGKKIGPAQIKWAIVTLLSHPIGILVPLAVAVVGGFEQAAAGPGPHSFTIALYEFTSESANNGSAMAPILDSTPFFNVAGSLVMLFGRYVPMLAMLAIGGALARQPPLPVSSGTLKTSSATFTLYLVGFVIIVTGLLFFPVLAMGPWAQGVNWP